MGQNTSSAVMAQRADPTGPDVLDFFPTPPWATRALLVHVLPRALALHGLHPRFDGWSVLDPACGAGDMADPLGETFGTVIASDIFDYGYPGAAVADFLDGFGMDGSGGPPTVDWVITNPPFKVAEAFVWKALEVARVGVAMFCRLPFQEGVDRYAMFEWTKPVCNAPFAERVPLVKGRLDPQASSATAYAWFVWIHGWAAREDNDSRWIRIPPCRAVLTRPHDYDRYPDPEPEAPLFEDRGAVPCS